MRSLLGIIIYAVGTLGSPAVWPESVTTTVSGTFNRSQENGCVLVSAFYYRVDCSYNHHRKKLSEKDALWVGPTANPVYYQRNSVQALPNYTPEPDDERIAPTVSGTFTVDNQDTLRGEDDVVSGALVVGPAARNIITRSSAKSGIIRAIESWESIQHTMDSTPVNMATPNEVGGFDYVIGTKGFPKRICRKEDSADCFPSAYAPLTTDGQWGADVWSAPGDIPIGRDVALGGNVGAATSAVFVGYLCIDGSAGKDCANGVGVWGAAANQGLDNLVLQISTDEKGNVIQAHGYWTNEYRVGVGPAELQSPDGGNDSWLGGYLEVTNSMQD